MAHENFPSRQQETNSEYVPDEREVLDVIEHYAHGGEIFRKREDEKGLYLLEVRVTDKEDPKKYVQYEYMRKGSYPEGSSAKTNLETALYEDDVWVGGEELARFIPETGEWKKFELNRLGK